jgi:NADH pyrophosphatase NudC (nudix superfamily)
MSDSNLVWKPHVTVAAVIEKNQRFLLVEEHTSDGLAFNQPAGHLEAGESLVDAVKREVLEETACDFEPQHIIALQLWRKSPSMPSFLRICFSGKVGERYPDLELDEGIVDTHWLNREQIQQQRLRSPLVLESIDYYLDGQQYPLSLLKTLLDNHE